MSGKSYKLNPCIGTVASVGDAYSALTELGDECREIVDNASEGLQQTQRIQTLEETAGVLEGMDDQDVPESVRDLPIHYTEFINARKGRSPSRSVRCTNAAAVLYAAAAALEEWLAVNAEHDDFDDVTSLKDQLENDAGEAENCEFPGMYG